MAFKEYLEQRVESDWSPRAAHQYVSAASIKDRLGRTVGACMRKEWFRLQNCKPSDHKNLRSRCILSTGNTMEDALVEQLDLTGRLVQQGVKLYWKKMNLSGEIDVIARDDNDELCMVEVKTYGGFFSKNQIMGESKKVGAGWGRRGPGTPRESHLMQIGLYLFMRSKADVIEGKKVKYNVDEMAELVRDIETGYLIYIDREDPKNVTEFKIKLKDNGIWYRAVGFDKIEPTLFCSIEDILARVIELNDYHINEVVPPRGFSSLYNKDQLAEAYRRDEMTAAEKKTYDKDGWVRKDDWQCRAFKDGNGELHGLYCQYHKLCRLVDLEDFTLDDHRVPLEEKNE